MAATSGHGSVPPATRFRRPGVGWLALEGPRTAIDAAGLLAAWPLLRRATPGDGHPVLVLPGLAASDVSTRPLRRFLRDLGYAVHGSQLGRNLGPTPEAIAGLEDRVRELARRYEEPMSVIGWSLGGIYAREIARAAPAAVRQVITLGSPFRLRDRRASNAAGVFEMLGERHPFGGGGDPRPDEEVLGPLPVPGTAVYSKSDGIVPWQACLEVPAETSESIEVLGSHVGLGVNPAVFWIVADRLGQPVGTWCPFRPTGPARLLFVGRHDPDHRRG